MVEIEKTDETKTRQGFPVKMLINGTWQCFTLGACEEVRVFLNDFNGNPTKVEGIVKDWYHFCECINIKASFLDADALKFMNEFVSRVNELK